MGWGGEGEDGRGVVGTPLVEQNGFRFLAFGWLIAVSSFSLFVASWLQSCEVSKFLDLTNLKFMCLMDIDLISNISKMLLDGFSPLFGARLSEKCHTFWIIKNLIYIYIYIYIYRERETIMKNNLAISGF